MNAAQPEPLRAGIGLGSNVGNRFEHLRAARERIRRARGVSGPLLASRVYATEPVGCPPGTPEFLNAVVEIGFSGEPADLLSELRRIEGEMGRPDTRERNRPRAIDLDLLYVGDRRSASPELGLPHRRIAERRFVLEPLAEIRPDLVLPGCPGTVTQLLERLPAAPRVAPLPEAW